MEHIVLVSEFVPASPEPSHFRGSVTAKGLVNGENFMTAEAVERIARKALVNRSEGSVTMRFLHIWDGLPQWEEQWQGELAQPSSWRLTGISQTLGAIVLN